MHCTPAGDDPIPRHSLDAPPITHALFDALPQSDRCCAAKFSFVAGSGMQNIDLL
jgi:hypothetical protein